MPFMGDGFAPYADCCHSRSNCWCLAPKGPQDDACVKAIASPRSAQVKSDCSSFLSKTLSPCPITLTKTSTSIKTAKTATTTTTLFTTTDQSFFSTQEQTQFTTSVLPETTTSLTTQTTTTSTIFETERITTTFSTAIVTSTAVVTSTLPPVLKRDATVTPSILPDRPHHARLFFNNTLAARQQKPNDSQCFPLTWGAEDIPKYAQPCRGSRAYSTACQKLGIGERTTTVQPSAATTTTTTTLTTTPMLTATQTVRATTTKVITSPITQLRTTVNTVTKLQTVTTTTTTILTSTITSIVSAFNTSTTTTTESVIATSTQILTSTATATPTPPAPCPGPFILNVTGSTAGIYIRSFGESEKMGFTNNITLAATLALDNQTRLYEPSTGLYPNTDDGDLYYVYQETPATIGASGWGTV
ncbi:hypothetical protein GQ44DRAFT_736446 [Phaeosphaeriaceae sp. PMI808]|nr:hypothetical protein GQ44DRAFT_736446 [Phaeosphaeriaceae sp. PMI808]